MKIIKNEVRTITTISLTIKDLNELMDSYNDCDNNQFLFPDAFKQIDTNDRTMGYLRTVMENLAYRGNGATFKYIAYHFGFDGFDNAGYYHKASGEYRMVVYTEGNTL